MEDTVNIAKSDIWKAIWLADNASTPSKISDLLKSFLPSKEIKSSPGKVKFAIVIGHNKSATGAYAKAPLNMSEFQMHSLITDLLVKRADSDPNIEIKGFERKPVKSYTAQILECYKRVNDWDPDYVIELHFNWLNGAGRVEMIYHTGSKVGLQMAKVALKTVSNFIPGKQKTIPRGKKDRGGLSLASAKAPAIMTEAFDCSNEDHRKTVSDLGIDGQARMYYTIIEKISKLVE